MRDSATRVGGADDLELVEGIRRRDERAAADLFDRHAGALLALVRRMLGGEADAEEIVEDTLMHLWNGPDAWDPDRGDLGTYLTVYARGRALDLLRTRRRRHALVEGITDDVGAVLPFHRPVDPGEALEQSERKRLAHKALASLSDLQRECIELAYFGGYSQREIAERLETPLGTVKTRIRDGMQRLRVEVFGVEGGTS